MAHRLKKDDLVVVISGKSKGEVGRILKVAADNDRVIVEGANLVKKHQKPTPTNPQGGILEVEAAIHVSNVMLQDPKDEKPTRVRMGTDKDGKKVRIAVKSGSVID
jgi:large subunit ribosomal protein L24